MKWRGNLSAHFHNYGDWCYSVKVLKENEWYYYLKLKNQECSLVSMINKLRSLV